ncbi:MAG: hypothetical protein AAF975_08905, partial [Spirochaetota bacterium]
QGIGILKSEEGINFIQEEISRLNTEQRSYAIADSDEKILRQLMYSLLVSEDKSLRTTTVLRNVSVTPYAAVIRKMALDILRDIS